MAVTQFQGSTTHPRALPISIGTWHGMIEHGLVPDRAELIRGVICEKMAKTFLHTAVLSRLGRWLENSLGKAFWVRREDPLTLADSEPEPDISVVPGVDLDYAPNHPTTALLVVEVAVSSMAEDRELCSLYAEAGVAEYWIVDVRNRCVEVFTGPLDGQYQNSHVVACGSMLNATSVPGIAVNLEDLFAGLGTAK